MSWLNVEKWREKVLGTFVWGNLQKIIRKSSLSWPQRCQDVSCQGKQVHDRHFRACYFQMNELCPHLSLVSLGSHGGSWLQARLLREQPVTVAMTPQPPTPQRRARETTGGWGASSHRAGGFEGPQWQIPAVDKAGMRVWGGVGAHIELGSQDRTTAVLMKQTDSSDGIYCFFSSKDTLPWSILGFWVLTFP